MTEPLTRTILRDQFSALGLSSGQTLLLHSSMKRLGSWIIGGAQTVIEALLDVVGEDGTLMMPTHTTDNTEPSRWQNPPVPEAWWQIIRDNMPPFDPALSPTQAMGTIPELFRRYPGVRRSDHPIGSFAATGKHAAYLTANHDWRRDMFGEESPIGKLYALDGFILLLGVGYENCTSLHLAEYRANWESKADAYIQEGAAVYVAGQRQWVTFSMMGLDTDDFDKIGAAFEQVAGYTPGKIGQGTARLIAMRPLVDFAVDWMSRHRI